MGYTCFEILKEVELLNQLYDRADLFDSFFIASAKLKKKIINLKGKVIKKIYEKPKTPYQRLIESKDVPKDVKLKLKLMYKSLNMVKLKEEMDVFLKMLFSKKKCFKT